MSNWCSNGIHPIHACSSNPIEIRKECELLKCNLLDRLRQIFFTASVNAYYGSFIPCCFSQVNIVTQIEFPVLTVVHSSLSWSMTDGGTLSMVFLSFLAVFFSLSPT